MELNRVNELRHVQWFTERKRLSRDTPSYICKFNELVKSFNLKKLITQILSRAKMLVENL